MEQLKKIKVEIIYQGDVEIFDHGYVVEEAENIVALFVEGVTYPTFNFMPINYKKHNYTNPKTGEKIVRDYPVLGVCKHIPKEFNDEDNPTIIGLLEYKDFLVFMATGGKRLNICLVKAKKGEQNG